MTAKHKKWHLETNGNKNKPKTSSPVLTCEKCCKEFKNRSGLWKHKKLCNCKEDVTINPNQNDISCIDVSYNLIFEIVKQNQEFKELIFEQNKQLVEQNKKLIELAEQGKTINNTTNNNNNNQFNLQFFLNEQCKDALNIEDFVKQIKLQLSDLDMIGRVGYVNGMSKIIIRNLNELDIYKRPIHCTDLKRETLYVKDNNAWEKEKGENLKLKKAIKGIECKNIKQIPHWVEANPTSEDTETKKHLEYHNIVLEVMGGSTLEDDNKKHEKIIRNVAKEVIIDKTIK